MTTKSSKGERDGHARWSIAAAITILMLCDSLHAQTFNSGSNGSDGALSLTTAGTYTFDPNDTVTFGRVLDADGDGVYNFTTINIAAGVILKITGSKVNRPVYWLATGAVTISGQIDLSGQGAMPTTSNLDQRRIASIPGAGGYPGGVGGFGTGVPAQAGQGPGGGAAGTPSTNGKGGNFTGNRFLVPLVGGSGGGGAGTACGSSSFFGPAGGAGGGAIAILSSTSIAISGSLKADGGIAQSSGCSPGVSGGGSGGAIRLAAPLVSGNGTLSVQGAFRNDSAYSDGSAGQVRVEAIQQQFSFSVQPAARLSVGTPSNPFLPTSFVRVVRVGGIAVPLNPSASFVLPDVSLSQTQAVTLDIEARNVPVGTIVKLEVFAENATDNTVVNQVVDSTPLAASTTPGTLTAAASFTFPAGFSRCWVRATWTQ